MIKNFIKTTLFLLTLILTQNIFSQTIFFSVTGDTVCYLSAFGFETDSLHIGHTAFIKVQNKYSEPLIISSFTVNCEASNTCLETIPKDTTKKYNLLFDGTDKVWGPKSDIIVSVKPTVVKVVDTSAFGPKFIYQAKVAVLIACKGQKLYVNYFDIMFKGNSPQDFPENDIVRVKGWRKKNTKKYYIELSVKEYQVFERPLDKADYRFEVRTFIL